MSETSKRPPPPEDFDENPEWTDEDFAKAERGLPKTWKPTDSLRRVAAELRHQADILQEQADAMDRASLKKAG